MRYAIALILLALIGNAHAEENEGFKIIELKLIEVQKGGARVMLSDCSVLDIRADTAKVAKWKEDAAIHAQAYCNIKLESSGVPTKTPVDGWFVLQNEETREVVVGVLNREETAKVQKLLEEARQFAKAKVEAERKAAAEKEKPVHVSGYVKKDGTVVAPYDRAEPHKLEWADVAGGYLMQGSTFLGKVSVDPFEDKGLNNSVGDYGSKVGTESIFNKVSDYGGERGEHSPFNPKSEAPPKLYSKDGTFLAYLSTNEALTPRLDPATLVGWIKTKE
jgi:hypothetical protein